MTPKKRKAARTKGRRPGVVRLPVRLLRASGLDIKGVPVSAGRVSFEIPDDVLTGARLLEQMDVDFWNELATSSRKAARERIAAGKKDEAALETLVAAIGKAASRHDPRAAKRFAQRVRLERAALAKLELSPSPISPSSARMRKAVQEMRAIAVVKQGDKTYFLSTQRKKRPIVVAVVAAAGAAGVGVNVLGVQEFLFWAEVILELAMGVATIMGAKINHNVRLGPWIEKLADLIRRNPRLTQLLSEMATNRGSISATMLLDLLWNFLNMSGDLGLDFLLAVCDIGFWAGMYCLAKAAAKMSPGWGQAILAAEIGIVVVELVAKIARHFLPPPPPEPGDGAPPPENGGDNDGN